MLDPVPSKLLKEVLPEAIDPLLNIVNLSLGYVTKTFKLAVIKSPIKKPQLHPNELINYRPISNLPFLSKLLEKVVWQWRDIESSIVTHTRNLCSAINPSKVHTHTAVNTHTPWTHTRKQWAAIYAAAPGEQLRVRCLAQGHLSRGIAPKSWYCFADRLLQSVPVCCTAVLLRGLRL